MGLLSIKYSNYKSGI